MSRPKNLSILVILLFVVLPSVKAHTATRPTFKNSIMAALGGSGILCGLHYERKVLPRANLYAHTGLGIYGTRNRFATVPFGINYVVPLSADKFSISLDIGASAIFSKADVRIFVLVKQSPGYVNTNFWNFMPHIGLRHCSKHGVLFRAQLNPIIGGSYGFIPWAGFAIGKMF
jgi:hypothetical protein